VSSKVQEFVADRKEFLSPFHGESIPHMTLAGAIDFGADWAICTETWYEKRNNPGFKLSVGTSDTEGIEALVEKYDAHLDRIHALAFPPHEPLSTVTERSITPCPSRPSLNFSVSTTDTGPSSDDSHHILVPVRRLFGFAPGEKKRPESPQTPCAPSPLQETTTPSDSPNSDDIEVRVDERGGVITPEPPEVPEVDDTEETYGGIAEDSPPVSSHLSSGREAIPSASGSGSSGSPDDGSGTSATEVLDSPLETAHPPDRPINPTVNLDITPRRRESVNSQHATPRAFPRPPDTPIAIVRRGSIPPPMPTTLPPLPTAIETITAPSVPPPPPPKGTLKSIRRKRRPTLPHLFLGLGKSSEVPPPLPPMPLDH